MGNTIANCNNCQAFTFTIVNNVEYKNIIKIEFNYVLAITIFVYYAWFYVVLLIDKIQDLPTESPISCPVPFLI